MRRPIFLLSFIIVFLVLVISKTLMAQFEPPEKEYFESPFSNPKVLYDLSLIMDFGYLYRTEPDRAYDGFEIPFFLYAQKHIGTNDFSSKILSTHNGFNLNYGKFGLQSGIDKYFNLYLDFIFDEDIFKLNEIYANTTSLPWGFSIKVGRFLSSFGSFNEQPRQYRIFCDTPLAYQVFLGDNGLLENGAQVIWKIPVDFGLRIGVEVLQGENKFSYGKDSISDGSKTIQASTAPNLYTVLLDSQIVTGNVNVDWGVSFAYGQSRIDNQWQATSGFGVYADTMLLDFDLSIKYYFDAYRWVAVQGEFIYRTMDGNLYENSIEYETKSGQSGFYAQLLVRPIVILLLGARAEMLLNHELSYKSPSGKALKSYPKNMMKFSGLLDITPTEFSKIRLQYNYDASRFSYPATGYQSIFTTHWKKQVNHEVMLNFTMAIGLHGAYAI